MILEEAYAKVNLCFSVGLKRGAKHSVDGIFAETDVVKDVVRAEKRNDGIITVSYADGRSYDSDTAYAAAERIISAYGAGGADFFIEKGIPEQRGLGGSSADAAAVARLLAELYGLGTVKTEILAEIGSDVPYCYYGGTKRVSGFGEILTDVAVPKLYFTVLSPSRGVSTAECYGKFDEVGGERADADAFLADIRGGKKPLYVNALQRAAEILNPEIAEGAVFMKKVGFDGCMTGSGSALVGVETDENVWKYKTKKLRECVRGGFAVYGPKE
jgi:4-diphosphocytidyl-2-C-methyl-D-erythritol kinase